MREELLINSLREQLTKIAAGLDNKRKKAWCEYGYKETLDFNDLLQAYRRNGIAHGIINKVVNKCWSKFPEIYEGSEADKDDVHTPYEKEINNVLNNAFWREFKEADKRRLVGRYSGLVLYFNDAHSVGWGDPVMSGSKLKFVKAAWENNLSVQNYDEDGNPVMWNYIPPKSSGRQEASISIHNDRIFILGDMSSDGMSILEPIFNNFVNLEKVEGGSAESYLKNASRQLHINYEADAEVEDMGEGEGKDFKTRMNDLVRDINTGGDTVLLTQGATSQALVSNVPDPTPVYDINLKSIATGVRYPIPLKILVGNENGERSSTEDLKQFNSGMQGRRESEISHDILRLLTKLFGLKQFEEKEVGVKWDDLTTPTTKEKLENALQMVVINRESANAGDDQVFDTNEVRDEAGFDTSTYNSEE